LYRNYVYGTFSVYKFSDSYSISDPLNMKKNCAYHEQLQQQHQQKQQGLLLLLAERILLAPVELEFNGPSLPAANVVGDPNVAPTADMFENDAELVFDMGGKERVPKPSHTSSASFSNMSAVGATLGSPTTLAAGRDGPLNSNSTGANNIRSASSNNKPCCFCWCCCCSCSW
jgi:hypothetical protein